jgi:tRNA 2-thiouridine synthesizing protein E
MTTTTIGDREIHVDAEGFLTDPEEWDAELAEKLAAQIGIEMTIRHWEAIRLVRSDFQSQHESPTVRRVSMLTGIPIKDLFTLFPAKPAKKMAYIAGVPKPRGCV